MKVSRKTEYALRALIRIAGAPPGAHVQVQELCREEKIPAKFLEQILLNLRNAGVLNSKRGVGGGYSLRRAASEISAGEVIRLMDGPLAPIACASPNPHETCTCPDPNTCALRVLMTDVRNELSRLLDNRTLDDIIKAAPSKGALVFEI